MVKQWRQMTTDDAPEYMETMNDVFTFKGHAGVVAAISEDRKRVLLTGAHINGWYRIETLYVFE